MRIKKITCFSLTFVMLALFSSVSLAKLPIAITDYHQTFIPGYDQKNTFGIAIRMYYIGAAPYFLVVNPNTFATETLASVAFSPRVEESERHDKTLFTMKELNATPYMRALKQYTSGLFYPFQNDGITHAEYKTDARFLTIDMCPSTKPFEKAFFQRLANKSKQENKAIPITLSITGLWIIGHPKEFNWLLQQQADNTLQITWMNHSFSHLYFPDLTLRNDFLLTGQTRFSDEVLETEKLLLEQGQLPSVFFRFPGLASDKQLIKSLYHFGLIPVGADAWLAKGQPAKPGSIILVHGNGNEPAGIKKVIPLLNNPAIHFIPLSQAFKNIKVE